MNGVSKDDELVLFLLGVLLLPTLLLGVFRKSRESLMYWAANSGVLHQGAAVTVPGTGGLGVGLGHVAIGVGLCGLAGLLLVLLAGVFRSKG